MRRDYTPLDPLPDLSFEADSEVKLLGISGRTAVRAAERYGQYAVIEGFDAAFKLIPDLYFVCYPAGNVLIAIFKNLRVARSYALELDETLDFAGLLDLWRSGRQAEAQEIIDYISDRAAHPSSVAYKLPPIFK